MGNHNPQNPHGTTTPGKSGQPGNQPWQKPQQPSRKPQGQGQHQSNTCDKLQRTP